MTRQRRAILCLFLVLLAGIAIAAFARRTPPIVTDSDFAVTELYTELATRGQLLVGPYSRFGWNHPGPLYFYLQAPFYAAGGHRAASIYATALAINLTAVGVLVWVMARASRGPLMILAPLAVLGLAERAPRLLASPWTAHVPVIPGLTFVALCAAVIAGRRRFLPLAVLFGSFIMQTHVGFGPTVLVLLGISAGAIVLTRQDKRAAVLILSVCVGLALWLPPAVDMLSRGGGNVAMLWRFFVTAAGHGHSMSEAFAAWSYGLSGLFLPDFRLPWGGHFGMPYLRWATAVALVQLLALAIVIALDFRRGRSFEGAAAVAALVASTIGLWGLTRIEGDILNHEILWLTALGAFNVAVVTAEIAAALPRLSSGVRSIPAAGCALVVAALAFVGVAHLQELTASERRGPERRRIPATYESILEYLRKESIRKPVIDVEGDAWSESAGVLLRLLQDGRVAAVTPRGIPMFTDAFGATGEEDALLTVSAVRLPELTARPENVVVRDRAAPYVYATPRTAAR
jgi:hypothetical protein